MQITSNVVFKMEPYCTDCKECVPYIEIHDEYVNFVGYILECKNLENCRRIYKFLDEFKKMEVTVLEKEDGEQNGLARIAVIIVLLQKGETMRLIDADALMEAIRTDVMGGLNYESFIKEAPTIDAAPRWIPCEERLPDDGKDVLISYRYKEDEGDTSHVYIDITSYGHIWLGNMYSDYKAWRQPFEYFYSNYEVIAWMPLPEPYKG